MSDKCGRETYVKLDDSDGIIPIVVLAELRLNSCDAYSVNTFHTAVLAHEPER